MLIWILSQELPKKASSVLSPGSTRGDLHVLLILRQISDTLFVSSNYGPMIKIIKRIQENGNMYCEAIDSSIQTAESGHIFSTEVIQLCELLLSDTSSDDLANYLSVMKNISKNAHGAATQAAQRFRAVRTGILQVCSVSYFILVA